MNSTNSRGDNVIFRLSSDYIRDLNKKCGSLKNRNLGELKKIRKILRQIVDFILLLDGGKNPELENLGFEQKFQEVAARIKNVVDKLPINGKTKGEIQEIQKYI
jgi:hypothetical protein